MALPGTLTLDDRDVDQGTVLAFTYAVPADRASDKNWVGLWPDPGDGPVDGSYVGPQSIYGYAPGTSGTVTLSSGSLPAGDYQAFYLYDDGYASLADPVPFTVRDSRMLPTPRFTDDFGRHLQSPAGMARDSAGRFWVADSRGRSVHHYGRDGRLLGKIGASVLHDPQDVVVGGGRVYVADAGRSVVDVFTPRGRHLATIGHGRLDRPRGVALDGHRLLVSDVGHNRVARFDTTSHRLVGEITTGVHVPHGITVDGERTWVVSSSRQYDGDNGVTCFVKGKPTITLGYGQHSVYGALSNPAHVAVDSQGLVLVTVPDYGFVSRFRTTGPFVGEFGTAGDGLLRQPQGLVVADDGAIFVADTGNRRVARFGGRR